MNKVLDHGYCEVIEHWGSDERIIEAARMSTNKGFQGWGPKEDGKPGDEKLLRYLWEHKHATPFEMAGVVFEVKAPIFVFREWHRHRTQSYNEMSGRYVPLPDENYIPTIERLMMSGGANRQAQGFKPLAEKDAADFQIRLGGIYCAAQAMYEEALESGVPKELARIHLPVARYSRMRTSANLRNWLGFLALRCDPNAMYEIRMYANVIKDELRKLFPRTMEIVNCAV